MKKIVIKLLDMIHNMIVRHFVKLVITDVIISVIVAFYTYQKVGLDTVELYLSYSDLNFSLYTFIASFITSFFLLLFFVYIISEITNTIVYNKK